MTVEQFDKLTARDFQNGAVRDEIRRAVEERKRLTEELRIARFDANVVVDELREQAGDLRRCLDLVTAVAYSSSDPRRDPAIQRAEALLTATRGDRPPATRIQGER